METFLIVSGIALWLTIGALIGGALLTWACFVYLRWAVKRARQREFESALKNADKVARSLNLTEKWKMGDRAQVEVKENGKSVFLYTHWRGSDLPKILKAAMTRGRGRWSGDPSYLARIIFSEMIKDEIMGETGYGISTTAAADAHTTLVVDIDKQTVGKKSFEEYVK